MDNMITFKDKKQKEYLDIIDGIESSLFPDMSLKQILWNETYYCLDSKITFKGMIRLLFFKVSVVDSTLSSNDLLCLYTKNYRNDHDGYWEKIKEDAGPHDNITIRSKVLKLDLFSAFKKFVWYQTAKKELNKIPSTKDKKYLARQMAKRKSVLEDIKKLNIKPEVVMCFFDSAPDENVLMQYFKNQGAITITNQHGQALYQSTEYDRMNQSQILNFKCDYYFAKGNKQIEQFLMAGFSREHFRAIGIVGGVEAIVEHHDSKCFGIYLDCPSLPFADTTNLKMIETGKLISKTIGYKYIIKTHPAEKKGKYNSLADESCVGIYGKETTLQETFSKVDFCITHASATYVDVYIYGLRCFRMKTEVYYPLSYEEDEFETVIELETKLEKWNGSSLSKQVEYIEYVRKMYDSGWQKGDIEKAINDILEHNCGK